MTQPEIDKVLADHKAWLTDRIRGVRAELPNKILCYANLRGADLRYADLRGADLRYADLQGADMRGADLCDAVLCNADLSDANLRDANLEGADMHGADLRNSDLSISDLEGADMRDAYLQGAELGSADLRNADLRGANIDHSAWPLYCGSLSPRIDKRIAAQLLYHTLCAMQSCADKPDVAAVLKSKPCLRLANQFHRVGECGRITAKGRSAR